MWERTAASVGSYSKDEDVVKESLIKKMTRLQDKLKHTVNSDVNAVGGNYHANVKDLERQVEFSGKIEEIYCTYIFSSTPLRIKVC